MLVQQPNNACVWLFVENMSSQCQEFSNNITIGHIDACHLSTDDCADTTINVVNEDTDPPHCLLEEQKKELLSSLICMANSTLTDSQVHMVPQLILSHHDEFSLQEQECGEVDSSTHVLDTDNHPPNNQPP